MAFTVYTVDPDKEFEKSVKNALLIVDDLRIPFGTMARDFYTSNRLLFNKKPGAYPGYKDPDGGYVKQKRKNYGSEWPILVASGRLRDSLTESTAPNEDTVQEIGKRFLVLGTKVMSEGKDPYPYARALHYGTVWMRPRPIVVFGPENAGIDPSFSTRLQRWLGILEGHIEQELQKRMAK